MKFYPTFQCVCFCLLPVLCQSLMEVSIDMGGAQTTTNNEYLCTAFPLADLIGTKNDAVEVVGIVAIYPNVSLETNSLHHLKIAACTETGVPDAKYWPCNNMANHSPICGDDSEFPMYGWNYPEADPLIMPDGAAYIISTDQYIVLQAHYPTRTNEPDFSGMTLKLKVGKEELEAVRPAKVNSDLQYDVTMGDILPPRSTSLLEVQCDVPDGANWLLFGGLAHTHSHGRLVCLHKVDKNSKNCQTLSCVDPQLPQSYRPLNLTAKVNSGDKLAVRCVLQNPTDEEVRMGFGADEEMCAFFTLYLDTGMEKDEQTKLESCTQRIVGTRSNHNQGEDTTVFESDMPSKCQGWS